MKREKWMYWGFTGLFSAGMLFSAFTYFTAPEAPAMFAHFGFPDYFRVELGVAKIVGVLVLLGPWFSKALKLLAYSGFGINLVSAFIAHKAVGDPAQTLIAPVLFMAVLVASYYCYERYRAVVA